MTLSKKHFIFLFLLFIPFIFSDVYGFKSGKPKGVYHRVKKGETLYSIARAYSVHVQDLAEVNNVENPDLIEADQVLFVPHANEVIEDVMLSLRAQGFDPLWNKPSAGEAPVSKSPPGGESPPHSKPLLKSEGSRASDVDFPKASSSLPGSAAGEISEAPEEEAAPMEREELPPKTPPPAPQPKPVKTAAAGSLSKEELPTEASGKLQFDKKRFIWPVKGRVISRFGIQPNKMYHNWISISGKDMTPVIAAAGGTVIFSSELKDYGETIIIKHADNFATVYTHLKTRKVRLDDTVRKGDTIALIGKIGEEDKVYLNFEVRHQNRARNPFFFLP